MHASTQTHHRKRRSTWRGSAVAGGRRSTHNTHGEGDEQAHGRHKDTRRNMRTHAGAQSTREKGDLQVDVGGD